MLPLITVSCINWTIAMSGAPERVPLFYHDAYNFGPAWLSRLHPFDGHQYRTVFEKLRTAQVITPRTIRSAYPISKDQLVRVHSQEYVERLFRHSSKEFSRITGINLLYYAPNWITRKWLLSPMLHAAGGTMAAVEHALKHGWAINLGGGFHHATHTDGQSGCAIADIPLAVCRAFDQRWAKRILIIDLDAHQANGIEELLLTDTRVRILDLYEPYAPPGHPQDLILREQLGQWGVPLPAGAHDNEYMDLLITYVERAITKAFSYGSKRLLPDLIVYLAGTDPLESDPHSYSALSPDTIIERDAHVFRLARSYHIPIAVIMVGGYSPESADVIAQSITTLLAIVDEE